MLTLRSTKIATVSSLRNRLRNAKIQLKSGIYKLFGIYYSLLAFRRLVGLYAYKKRDHLHRQPLWYTLRDSNPRPTD